MHTCKNCKQYLPNEFYVNFGECLLMGDSNDFVFYQQNDGAQAMSDRCYGWDYESYVAGVYVGKDFGCIHWEQK